MVWHLKYGLNPHQGDAHAAFPDGREWMRVLNGQIGYVNLLDALRAWQLAQELARTLGRPAATSVKHVHPAGAALASPLESAFRATHFHPDEALSEIATAYARARAGDPVASFGDFIGLSEPVDESCARLIAREVSDGIIAPGYDDHALAILRAKKKGRYVVLTADPDYVPPPLERRSEGGLDLQQTRNIAAITPTLFDSRVSDKRSLASDAVRDLQLATIVVKHTPSNAVCVAHRGQAIGIGGGQQARIYATRAACDKADAWRLQLHPRVAEISFAEGASRTTRVQAVRNWIERGAPVFAGHDHERRSHADLPQPLTHEERQAWLAGFTPVVLSSDGYVPFRDNVDRARGSHVGAIAQPGGSANDALVTAAANEADIVMVHTGVRLFWH
jgi:phosphoribosylaminoimidazolecarboxamide formyltransferase / IMP cyclohydrolase